MKWLLRWLVVAVLAFALWWLGQAFFVTDETRIKRQISGMASAVEKNNLSKLVDAVASDYSDDHGLDKASLLGAARSFRQQYDAVLILITDLTVEVQPDHKTAQSVFIAKVLAKTRGGAAESEVRAERLRLLFRKGDDGWKLTRIETPELKFE